MEVVFPIEAPELKQRLIREILATSLADNVKARELLPEGSYRRVTPAPGQPLVRSQERFLELAAQNAVRRLNEGPPPQPVPAPRPHRTKPARKRLSG